MLSRNLKLFAGLHLILTVGVHYSFTLFEYHQWVWMYACALIYGVIVFALGWILGARDIQSKGMLGFGYHLATYLISNGVALLCIWAELSKFHTISLYLPIMFWWGIFGIGSHLIFVLHRRRSLIRGLSREEIFE